MAHRSSRHRIRPIAALALEAGTTIGPRCANVHLGPEDQRLHQQAGYTTAADPVETLLATPRSTSGRRHYAGRDPARVMVVTLHLCDSRKERCDADHDPFL